MVVAPLSLDERDYDRRKGHEFYRNVSERVGALAGCADRLVFSKAYPAVSWASHAAASRLKVTSLARGQSLHLDSVMAGPHYFTNMKVPFVQGRDFDERDQDGAPCVAVVNEVFAERYFGGTGPSLGKHLSRGNWRTKEKQVCEIVGVDS